MGNKLTTEQLAQSFSEDIGRAYREAVFACKATAMDDRNETKYWQKRIEREVPIVVKNAERKILEIMNYHPRLRKRYCLRKRLGLFRDKNILNINLESGFFDDLLWERKLKNFFPVNVEYHIDLINLSFEKVTLPYRP